MTDDISKASDLPDEIAQGSKEEGAGEADYLSFMPGQRLKKARELRGLTLEQVAKELHLSPRFVVAMEADAYKELPEPAFVRGYMRRYAQLVKLSADDIAAKFDQCYAADVETPEPDARPRNPIQILGAIRPRLRMRRLLSWASFGLSIVLLLGFLFWNGTGSRPLEAVPVEPVAAESPAAVDTPALAPAATPAAVPASAVAVPVAPAMNVLPSPSGPAVLPAPVAAARPAGTTGTDTLVITLTAESWISVRDAKQILVSELKRGGQTLTLKGEAPFSVNLGNAPATTLVLNGKPVDLKPYTQGAVASLTLKR